MTEEIVLRQPSAESFTYLDPQYRMGHLLAVLDCSRKESKYDEKAKCDKDRATFRAVDLDGEREVITFADNHDGIVRDIAPGSVGVLIGRIGTVKTKSGNDFFVLAEHTTADAALFHAWYADWQAGKPTATGWTSNRPPSNGGTPSASPAQRPVTAPTPPAATPATPAAQTPAIDLSTLDAGTLALLQKAMAQQGSA